MSFGVRLPITRRCHDVIESCGASVRATSANLQASSCWGFGAKVRVAKLGHDLLPERGAALFQQLGARAQRGARGPVTISPATELREHGYELDRGFGQAVACPLAEARVLSGK